MDPYENLANAIVLQAVKDWRESVRKLKRNQKNTDAAMMKKECEEFFLSDWFSQLTDMDGRYLLRRLNEEVQK